MNYTPTKYPQGTFSWVDITSTDITKTKAFLTGLFGWTAEDMPTSPGKPDYTMFSLDGKYVAGAGPAWDPKMPSYWANYITVDDVDAMAKKAEELGGKVIMPAMDVMDAGRMVGIEDPTGAKVMLWQPKRHIGAGIINTVGAMVWNELYTKDVEGAKKFYADLLGWTYEPMKDNPTYTLIKNNGRNNGGIFEITEEMNKMPPMWMVYFTVKNLAESVAKAKELGGHVWMDTKDIGVGKIATISDPAGAGFIIMEMSMPPEEWTE
jgi:predicted enzyme related to lactoylglutathione lyase